jgi:hypothetical protein
MGSLTDRRSARQRVIDVFFAQLDQLIPGDESIELKGRKFIDWENQADELDRSVTGAFLEERAALDGRADVDASNCGLCPSCGSARIYLLKRATSTERQTAHGMVVLREQKCRCRACGRHFSPSAGSMGTARPLPVVGQGGPKGRPRGRGAKLPKGG